MSKNRATEDALDALHALMAESMTEDLREAFRRARLPKSHDDYAPIDTKLYQAIRGFLKDNGIDAPAQSERFDGLLGQLKDIDPTATQAWPK